jgi:hypothetical protein
MPWLYVVHLENRRVQPYDLPMWKTVLLRMFKRLVEFALRLWCVKPKIKQYNGFWRHLHMLFVVLWIIVFADHRPAAYLSDPLGIGNFNSVWDNCFISLFHLENGVSGVKHVQKIYILANFDAIGLLT